MAAAISPLPALLRLGEGRFVYEDPVSGTHWELGEKDRLLLVLIQAGAKDEDVRKHFAQRFGEIVAPQQLASFRRALSPGRHWPAAIPTVQGPVWEFKDEKRLNAVFDALGSRLDWLCSGFGVSLVCGFAILAAYVLMLRIDRVLYDLQWLFHSSPVPVIAMVLVLKLALRDLPREVAVGIACRKHRGRVRGFGIRFLRGLIPFVYCDTGYSIALMKPRGLWTMLSVRLCCELLVWAVSILGWTMMPRGSLPGGLFLLVAFVTSVGLMAFALGSRSEADFLVSQALGIPRLRERAEATAWALLKGEDAPEPQGAAGRFWFRTLGLISFVRSTSLYVIVVGVGTWWLVDNYAGLGALLACALLVVWYHESIFSFLGRITLKVPAVFASWLHGWKLGILLLMVCLVIGLIPYNYELVGECSIIPEAQRGARAQLTGEIASVEVDEGGWVEQGAPIVVFNGREVTRDLEVTQAQLAQAEAELKLLEAGPREEDVAMAELRLAHWEYRQEYTHNEYQRYQKLKESNATSDIELQRSKSEWENAQNMFDRAQESLEKVREGTREERLVAQRARVDELKAQLKYHQQMSEQLTLRAPIAGRMITPSLRERIGQVAQKGDLIAVVQDDRRLQAVLAAHQSAAQQAQPGMAANLRLYGNNGALVRGNVQRVGGAILERDFTTSTVNSDDELRLEKLSQGYDPGAAYARILIEIDDDQAGPLKPGMSGYGRVVIHKEILGMTIFRHLKRFVCTEAWSWLP